MKNCKIILKDEENENVKRFTIIGGNILDVPDLTDVMQKFRSIEKVDFGWLGIRYVTKKEMRIMKNIKWVSFIGNQIQQLFTNTFNDLKKIEKIILAHNKLTILSPDLFVHNVELKEIWLQSNQIKIIEKGLFRKNVKLETVFLGKNKLVQIQIDFSLLPVFKNIDLRGNDCIDEWCGETSWCGFGNKAEMETSILLNCRGRLNNV